MNDPSFLDSLFFLSAKNKHKKKMIGFFIVIILLSIGGVVYLRPFRHALIGVIFSSIIYILLNIYFIWEGNYINEYEITISKINFHIDRWYQNFVDYHQRHISFMTENDIKNFFMHNNTIRDRMEEVIKKGADIVSYGDVEKNEKVFSVMLLGYRDKNGYYDDLNWQLTKQMVYMINTCIIDQSNETVVSFSKEIFKDRIDYNKYLVSDAIVASYITIAPSNKEINKYKLIDTTYHPIMGYQAKAIKKMFDRYTPNNMCFKNLN